jgi:endonuclease/exonuclease/phosphatase (EEP) superfamily protein YafD
MEHSPERVSIIIRDLDRDNAELRADLVTMTERVAVLTEEMAALNRDVVAMMAAQDTALREAISAAHASRPVPSPQAPSATATPATTGTGGNNRRRIVHRA